MLEIKVRKRSVFFYNNPVEKGTLNEVRLASLVQGIFSKGISVSNLHSMRRS